MLPRFARTANSGRYLDHQVKEWIVAVYQSGRSLREIAEVTGRSHSAVRPLE